MTRTVQDFKVITNRQIQNSFFILTVQSPQKLQKILPGQFAQVRVDGSPDTFLRRPFSFYDVNYSDDTLRFLIQAVGKGTQSLAKLEPGEMVSIIYPLGNSFTSPESCERVLIVGGGVGIAPFLHFAGTIKKTGAEIDILFGFRNADRVIEYDEFTSYGEVHITTEDGSAGEKGLVTGHSILMSKRFDRIYCCGPDPMMKAIASYARDRGIFCEVSLEHLMGCGFGICLCCTVETTRGNICTCTEGPVFNVKELKW